MRKKTRKGENEDLENVRIRRENLERRNCLTNTLAACWHTFVGLLSKIYMFNTKKRIK
jgi:hypothetical protein